MAARGWGGSCPKLGTSRGRTRTLLKKCVLSVRSRKVVLISDGHGQNRLLSVSVSWCFLGKRPLVLARGRHEPVGLERVRCPLRCLAHRFRGAILADGEP